MEIYSELGGLVEQEAVLMGSANLGRENLDYIDPWLDYNISFDGASGIGEYDDLSDAEMFNEDDGFHYARGRTRRRVKLPKLRRSGARGSRQRSRLSIPSKSRSNRLRSSGGRSGGLRMPKLRGKSGGRSRGSKRGGGFTNWMKNTFTTPEGRERRNRRRAEKTRSKRSQEENQRAFAKAAQIEAAKGPDPLLAAALAAPVTPAGTAAPGASDGMLSGWTTTQKVMAGVGVLAVLVLGGWAISASMKKKATKTKAK